MTIEQIITNGDLLEGMKKGDDLVLAQSDVKEAKINISFS